MCITSGLPVKKEPAGLWSPLYPVAKGLDSIDDTADHNGRDADDEPGQ
jgi:hypothetical protein